MPKLKLAPAGAAVLASMLILTSCTQNEVLSTLQASVAATEILVASLEAGGKIPAGTTVILANAIVDLPEAYRQTVAELDNLKDDAALRAVKIASYFAPTVLRLNLLPADAQVYSAAIAASIRVFIDALSTAQRQYALTVSTGKGKVVAIPVADQRAVVLGAKLAKVLAAQKLAHP